MKIFSRADIDQLLPMSEAITLMMRAFGPLADGGAQVPLRTHLQVPATGAEALFMPAYLPQEACFSLKMVTLSPDNPAQGLPFIRALVLLMDARNGEPLALLAGDRLTALRTGAGSGLATSLLAAPHASTLAIFGAGAQAFPQIEAVCCMRPIRDILLYNRNRERVQQLADTILARWPRMRLQLQPELAALRDAQVICTATRADMPLFAADMVAPGTHINAIGAYRPDLAELPPELIGAADIFVDEAAACLQEAGDLLQAISAGFTRPMDWHPLGQLLTQPRAWHPDSITIFKSVGSAAQDLVIAHDVWQRGSKLHMGQEVAF